MDEFLGSEEKATETGRDDEKRFLSVATQLYTQKGLSLRDVERMFSHIRLALLMLPKDKMTLQFMAEMLILLTFLKTYEPDFYARMKNKGLEIQSFVDQLCEIFHENLLKSEDKFDFWYTFVSLIISYHTYQDNPKDRRPLMRTDNATGLIVLNIKFPSWIDEKFMELNIKDIKYFSEKEYSLHTIIELLDLRTF